MLVSSINARIKIEEGLYEGEYEYTPAFSTKKLLGWYRKDNSGTYVDPHFSVENETGEFEKFHVSFDVGGRNVHFYYKFTHVKGLVATTGHTGWNDGFSSKQEEKAQELLDPRHKMICHNLAQQFFTAAVASDLAAKSKATMSEYTSKPLMKLLRQQAAFND